MTKRFFYNTENGELKIFNSPHVEFYHNNKDKILYLDFDCYVRGIITEENQILLRVFYPYENIAELTYNDLLKKSHTLLENELPKIKKALKSQGIKWESFVFNVTNEDVKEILKSVYV